MKRIVPILFLLMLLIWPTAARAGAVASAEPAGTEAPAQRRPKLGLTLAGGGAKGAAYIGVLKLFEEIGLEFDYVTGTSMGSIIGMLHSVGYSANQIDSLIRDIDWSVYLSNQSERRYMNSYLSSIQSRYLIGVPFNAGSTISDISEVARQKKNALSERREQMEAEKEEESVSGISFLKSLPGGYTTGSNLLNLFNGLCVGYQDPMSFDDLPIPFACVACDVVSGQPVVLRNGRLPDAVRASMAIPGVFAPVRYDDMMLVDGGLFNNFPVDVCQEMGADIVIGLEVTKDRGDVDADAIQSLPDLLTRLFDMMTRKGTTEHREQCAVYIRPDITGFGTLSFDSESIATIIERGYQAALAQKDALIALKNQLDALAPPAPKKRKPAENLTQYSPVRFNIASYEINGLNPVVEQRLIHKSGVDLLKPVTGKDIDVLTSVIYGTGAFKQLTYQVKPLTDSTYHLQVDTRPAEPHVMRFGIRYDTEEAAYLLLYGGWNENKLSGFKASTTLKLGYNPKLNLTLSLVPEIWPTFNLAANYHRYASTVSNEGKECFGANLQELSAEFYLSQFHSRYVMVKGGLRLQKRDYKDIKYNMEYLQQSGWSSYSDEYFDLMEQTFSSAPLGLFFDLNFDNRDKKVFADRGINLSVMADWYFQETSAFARNYYKFSDPGLWSLQCNFEVNVPVSRSLVLKPQVYARMASMVTNNSCYLSYGNYMGGYQARRYYPQQMPFVGLLGTSSLMNDAAVLRADLRWNFAAKHYLTAMVNYAREAYEPGDFFTYDDSWSHWGAGLEYSYNSLLGPVSLDIHWSDMTNDIEGMSWIDQFGIYLRIGYDF